MNIIRERNSLPCTHTASLYVHDVAIVKAAEAFVRIRSTVASGEMYERARTALVDAVYAKKRYNEP